jgi:PAS domain S-box-containing protein
MTVKDHRENEERLNLILRTVRDVAQQLVREKDPVRLIQGICDTLVKYRGYYNAWVALFDKSNALMATAESGLGDQFLPIVERLSSGEHIPCVGRSLAQNEVILTENPVVQCQVCPLSGNYRGRGAMTMGLTHDGRVFGVLCASLPAIISVDMQERVLFREISNDIAFALHGLELETENRKAQEALRHSMHQLSERIKELNCLYAISRLVDKRSLTIEQTLQSIVELVPRALQYPQNACACLRLGGRTYQTGNFVNTRWKKRAEIRVSGNVVGHLDLCYREKKPAAEQEIFLPEEKILVDVVAERIGKIIERKQAEESLRVSERRLRDLVENSLVGILILQDDQVVFKNPELVRLMGSSPGGFDLSEFDNIHPADVDKVKAVFQELSCGDSDKLDMEFRFYPEGKGGQPSDMKWIHFRASLIEHAGKNAVLINMMDVTRAKELEQLLFVQDKMASLGRVAAGIAHEIRNPLSGINIYINTLSKLYARDDSSQKVHEILKSLQSASHRIESVIRRVMDFSKPSAPRMVLADMNDPIQEAIQLMKVTLRKRGIGIEADLDPDLPQRMMDPRMIEEVIVNLIVNAADAMEHSDGAKNIHIRSSADNGRIVAKIADEGPGVPPVLKDKIFDPFFTTKNDSTGIGLNLCQRIIQDHGGSISVGRGQSGGAEFTIVLPKDPRKISL